MRVYFMTNRHQQQPMPHPEFDFTPTDNVSVGYADMTDPVPLDPALSSTVMPLTVRGIDTLPEDIALEIEQSADDHLLLYFHGFNYTFREAIQRTGWLSGWFGGGLAPVTGPILCFSFPSAGSLISFE
ncbi:MAG: alpha/beta hydrolase, partial [Alphaproteobacteria bacterium]|nr:alpha/beta hydrolase [Alphaproteobacteria bacterium]